jgi:hypothetical protein
MSMCSSYNTIFLYVCVCFFVVCLLVCLFFFFFLFLFQAKSPRATPEPKKPVWARNPTPVTKLRPVSLAVTAAAPSPSLAVVRTSAPSITPTAQPSSEVISPSAGLAEDDLPSFSYAMLSGPASGWDPAVDPTRRHFHLSVGVRVCASEYLSELCVCVCVCVCVGFFPRAWQTLTNSEHMFAFSCTHFPVSLARRTPSSRVC